MSSKKFHPMHFRDMTLENQTKKMINWSASYFLAADISRNEINNSKTYQIKEGIEKVEGFKVNLKTIETYYLYVRAMITEKVFFQKRISLTNCFSQNGTKPAVFLIIL